MPSPLGSPHNQPSSGRASEVRSLGSINDVANLQYKPSDLGPGSRSRPSSINLSEQVNPTFSPALAYADLQYKPTDMAKRISQTYHPSLVNIPMIPSPHGSPRIRPASIGGQGANKSSDMINRISQTYHPSLVNIPIIPSPHGSPRSRPTSIRMASAHPSLVNIPIMASPVPSPRSRPNSIHGSSQVSPPALRMI
jgi:hypothetical protein